MKGTDWLKAHPGTLVAGSPVDRNTRASAWGGRLSAQSDGRQRRYFLLAQSLTAKSPLCRPRQDNKNSHRAETEVSLRLMRQPSRRGTDHEGNSKNPLNVPSRVCTSFCTATPYAISDRVDTAIAPSPWEPSLPLRVGLG